ncbi:MAG: hypothetical protein QXD78_06020, partial [Candidatus Bathyarchaeia archaeon]
MSLIKQLIVFSMIALIILLNGHIDCVNSQVTKLDVKISQNIIIAERNNTITIEVSNSYKDLYDLDLGLNIPSPLAILSSSNHWRLSSLKKGESYRATFLLYAPKSALGNTFTGALTIAYKELGYISYTIETHSFNFIVYGWIEITIYDLVIMPKLVNPGSEIAISANILNKGNVAAMYTNATILPKDYLILTQESNAYLGQVDPNSPAPFSLITKINPEAQEGVYPITLLIRYQDDRHTIHELRVDMEIEVIKPSIEPSKPISGKEWIIKNASMIA